MALLSFMDMVRARLNETSADTRARLGVDFSHLLSKFWVNHRGEILDAGRSSHPDAIANGLMSQIKGYDDPRLLKRVSQYMDIDHPDYDDLGFTAYEAALDLGWVRGGYGKRIIYFEFSKKPSKQKVTDLAWDVLATFYGGKVSAVTGVEVDYYGYKTLSYSTSELFE